MLVEASVCAKLNIVATAGSDMFDFDEDVDPQVRQAAWKPVRDFMQGVDNPPSFFYDMVGTKKRMPKISNSGNTPNNPNLHLPRKTQPAQRTTTPKQPTLRQLRAVPTPTKRADPVSQPQAAPKQPTLRQRTSETTPTHQPSLRQPQAASPRPMRRQGATKRTTHSCLKSERWCEPSL